jgi:hypothetical protein
MYSTRKITFDPSPARDTVETLSVISRTFTGAAGSGAREALNQHVSPIVRDCLNRFLAIQEMARAQQSGEGK